MLFGAVNAEASQLDLSPLIGQYKANMSIWLVVRMSPFDPEIRCNPMFNGLQMNQTNWQNKEQQTFIVAPPPRLSRLPLPFIYFFVSLFTLTTGSTQKIKQKQGKLKLR